MARAKNRQTFNKMARERELTERRALKQAKKEERRRLAAEGGEPRSDDVGPETEESPADAERQ